MPRFQLYSNSPRRNPTRESSFAYRRSLRSRGCQSTEAMRSKSATGPTTIRARVCSTHLQKALARPIKPIGEWNTMDITIDGPHTIVHLNAVKVTDFTEGQTVPPKPPGSHDPDRGPRPDSGFNNLLTDTATVPCGAVSRANHGLDSRAMNGSLGFAAAPARWNCARQDRFLTYSSTPYGA
jgi:hypothetical protein